jgi:cytochrome c oxidase subunit 4
MTTIWLRRLERSFGVACAAVLVGIGFLATPSASSHGDTATSSRQNSDPANTQQGPARPGHLRLWLGPLLVWFVLLVVLGGSAWSAFFPLGALNPAINLLLAAFMLFLLATFLMDLRRASAIVRMVAAAGLFWVVFLFALTFTDYLSRRPTLPAAPAQAVLPGTPGLAAR